MWDEIVTALIDIALPFIGVGFVVFLLVAAGVIK